MKTVALAVLVLICPLFSAHAESIVTLKSGAVLQGDIVSDTNDVVQIRAYSHNHTISSLRDVARSDIQSIRVETPAEVAERTDYEALAKFQLDPNEEQTVDWYNQWIAVFQKFLDKYPASDKKPAVQHYIELCQAESQNVAAGKVKFGNRWMTVEERRDTISAQTAAAEQRRARNAAYVQAQQNKLALEAIAQGVISARGNVYELRADGALIQGAFCEASHIEYSRKIGTVVKERHSIDSGLIFVRGPATSFANTTDWSATIYPAGTYRYIDGFREIVVKCYALSPEDALAHTVGGQ